LIYSDGVHLISSESIQELHEFCLKIGIKRCWYHSSSKFPHYDIPKKKRKTFFIDNPTVIQASSREIVSKLKEKILKS